MPDEPLTPPVGTQVEIASGPTLAQGPITSDVVESLRSASEIFCDVVLRQIRDDSTTDNGPPPEQGSPVLDVLESLVNGITHGSDLATLRGPIEQLIFNQEARAKLIDNILLTHDYGRLPGFLRARASLEEFLIRCCTRGDLSPSEGLVFYKLVQGETGQILSRIKSGASSAKEIDNLVEKADFMVRVSEQELERKFSDTTPQNREIIRRMAYKLVKLSKA